MVPLVFVLDLFAALSFIAALWAIRDHRRRKGLPYPPGPPSLPIIGNLLDIPKEFSWLAYTRFSKKYGTSLSLAELLSSLTIGVAGNIMSFRVFGKVIIILNTPNAVKDLLEKRGDICSDRPVITFFEMYVLQFSGQACPVTGLGWDGNGLFQLLDIQSLIARHASSSTVASAWGPWRHFVRCNRRRPTYS